MSSTDLATRLRQQADALEASQKQSEVRQIGRGNLSKGMRKSIEDEPEQSQSDTNKTGTPKRLIDDV